MHRTAAERRDELKAVYQQAAACTRCPQLAAGRTTVVFGSGNADADLMFVGEAPGANEDKQGLPFVGQAGKLLDKLLGEIGLARGDAFVVNVLKCLRYTAMVQLGDGSWERIGRLVRSRYDGTVMSVDGDGNLVPRRVTGWHATPLGGRRVFRLTYRSAKNAGTSRVGIRLTGDHPVLTERGYVAVEDLRPNDRIATGQGLSDVAFDVVCGTVLGDGSLNASSSYLSMGHSERQYDYAVFKLQLLQELAPQIDFRSVAAVVGGASTYPVIHVRTRAHRALGSLRPEFYGAKKRVPEWIPDVLNPRIGMRYKLHPDVESSIPFDRHRYRRDGTKVMFDEVEVEDVTHEERGNPTYFCIDVEETHNFVTAGGVVHNCRPPGNRDPLPQEIANCQEYLFRQLELIQPKVVCTLGNFSTKLLRGDPTGITRLHGREEVRAIGPRTVRLYPLYHPAAALYTPSMVETLRTDFARIPELLALEAPEQASPEPEAAPAPPPPIDEPAPEPLAVAPSEQLGLF